MTNKEAARRKKKTIYKDGEPCPHKGCKHHVSHPCEGCGRIGAVGEVDISNPWTKH